jgi:hypothetical protein
VGTVSVLDADIAATPEIAAGAKPQRALLGRPLQERSTVPSNPEAELALTLTLPEPPAVTVRVLGSTAKAKSVTLHCVALEVLGLKLAFPE